MVKILRRIERLEEGIPPAPDDFPKTMTVCFVDSEKRVASEKVITFGEVAPPRRRWGLTPRRGSR